MPQNIKNHIQSISIDRLTVIGTLINSEKFQDNIVNNHMITERVINYSKVYGYDQSLKLASHIGHIDIKSRDSEHRGVTIRYEFNPNSFEGSDLITCKQIIGGLKNISISRLDIAVDMDIDYNNYLFKPVDDKGNRKRLSQVLFLDGTGKVETNYFGSRNSDYMYRLYNKKVEQSQKGVQVEQENWWRMEIQINSSKLIEDFIYDEYTPFYDMLVGHEGGFNDNFINECKNTTQFLMFKEVYRNRNYLSTMTRREKENFNDMLKRYEELQFSDGVIFGDIILSSINEIREQVQKLHKNSRKWNNDYNKNSKPVGEVAQDLADKKVVDIANKIQESNRNQVWKDLANVKSQKAKERLGQLDINDIT